MNAHAAIWSWRGLWSSTGLLMGAAVLVAGISTAQQRQGAPPPPTVTATLQPTAPPAYTYNPEGRRDPFVSLLARGTEGRALGKRPDGLAGLLTGELSLKGIVQNRGAFVAIVQGPDSKNYVVHANDRLFDGRVKAITADQLIILQEVNDPLSLTKQREVRKSLRGLDDGR